MIGNSIDFSLSNVWRCWYKFRRGKKRSNELELYSYNLEENLYSLCLDLQQGTYRHGTYRSFFVADNKKRKISVANIRDRVVHRLLYEYLVPIYDKTFLYDVWSCRKRKGLLGAIERSQKFLCSYKAGFVWRGDVTKFFDSVDCTTLIDILKKRISDPRAQALLWKVIASGAASTRERERERERERRRRALKTGIPIGNLTSQVFANIYLNEFDRFVVCILKPKGYVRYGDDFIIIQESEKALAEHRQLAKKFLKEKLKLYINPKQNIVAPIKYGIHFLGTHIFPTGRRLNKRNKRRVHERLTLKNVSSYNGLVQKHAKSERVKEFYWQVLRRLEEI